MGSGHLIYCKECPFNRVPFEEGGCLFEAPGIITLSDSFSSPKSAPTPEEKAPLKTLEALPL